MLPFIASGACIVYLLLGGCAPQWTRPDVGNMRGDAWADQDERACQQQAVLAMERQSANFYGSLRDLYGQNYQPYGRRSMQWIGAPGPQFDIDPVRRTLEEDRITDACMRAKGYTPRS